jgi:hypothetical protein
MTESAAAPAGGGAYEAQLEAELGRALVQQIRSLADALRTHPSRTLALGYLHGRMFGDE